MHGLPVSKYTKYGRLELVAIEWQVEIYKTNIQHPDCVLPNVMELFHWLTHPSPQTTKHMHGPAFLNIN